MIVILFFVCYDTVIHNREDFYMKWYTYTKEKVLELCKSTNQGLTEEEAHKRLQENGKNVLPRQKRDSVGVIFLHQFLDPIVILLSISTVFSFIVGEVVDAFAIFVVILADLAMGTYQAWKADKSAESLIQMIKVKVRVRRDGKVVEKEASELVVGDVVLLESGNKISADMFILSSSNLTVDESVLTGESIGAEKEVGVLPEDTYLAERKNMVFAGTSVLVGRAECVVVATALDTEIGHIHHTVTTTKETKSPLTIRMETFSKQISIAVVAIAILLAILLFSKGLPTNEVLLSVIALSVASMPEGLPLALTMALTIGSNRMAKKNVIVKRLNSVESLGSCTVIATDKTGTLTVNEQTAKVVLFPDDTMAQIDGVGYNDEGSVTVTKGNEQNSIQEIAYVGALNNEGRLFKKDGNWIHHGDSIDVAFLAFALKGKVEVDPQVITKQIPYESANKYSAVYYREKEEEFVTVKGSFEVVLNFCNTMKTPTGELPLDVQKLQQQNEYLAKNGYRVIALAKGKGTDIQNLTFLGMVGFIDPIREDAKTSIQECHKAGIKVAMITGDHPLTAFHIAQELNLVTSMDEVTTGKEVGLYLEKGEKEFDQFIKQKHVFTRVTPLEKLKIVESYKRMGEFVAVTGDGVNDAPAIRSANIGISMGSGTDVAKETASMIIVNDDFSSIVTGVKEGRSAYSNIRKVSYMLLSSGLAEVLFFMFSVLFNFPMPLVAIQLLWINIITSGLQDLALSFEPAEDDIMEQPPRKTDESIFNKSFVIETLISGIGISILVFGVWIYLLNHLGINEMDARGHIMVLMVFIQNMHVLNCRSEINSIFSKKIHKNNFVIFSIVSAIILQIIIMNVPFLSHLLQANTVPMKDMFILFILSLSILFLMEIYKWILRHKKRS